MSQYPNMWNGLIGLWTPSLGKQGNKLYDFSPSKNHGTLTNMTKDDWVAGKYGYALDFDGSNDFIELDKQIISDTATIFSICAWVRTSSATVQSICGQFTNSADRECHHLYLNSDGKIRYDEYTPPGGLLVSNNAVNDGEWHHIALIRNGSNRAIYIDGKEDVSDSSAETYTGAATDRWRIGSQAITATNIRFFNGRIGEVCFYNRALSSFEVACMYAGIHPLILKQSPAVGFVAAAAVRKRLALLGVG